MEGMKTTGTKQKQHIEKEKTWEEDIEDFLSLDSYTT
jgi:hypothetical protein